MTKGLTISFLLISLVAFGQPEKYIESAKKLKSYFSFSKNQDSIKYQKLFFEEFPGNFKDFNEIFGYDSEINDISYHGAPLYDGYDYISYFFSITSIIEKTFYLKIINISLGGRWDADAVNYFQRGLRQKIFQNPKLTFDLLKNKSDNEIKSFFFFFFHSVHPVYTSIPPVLKEMKHYDEKIYSLLEHGFAQALKESGH